MTMIEFVLATLGRAQTLFEIVLFVLAIAALCLLGFTLAQASDGYGRYGDEDERKRAAMGKRWLLRVFLPALIVSALLVCVPSLDDMWRVRINLLKLEAASPENVQKAGDHIETIVRGLECKYLGACGEPEKTEKK